MNATRSPGFKRRGVMLVLSSPSGAGKTTIARRLLADDANLWMSVSVTTRPRRSDEVPGEDYRFVQIG
ncbi:MAG: guanylate kinase, partial [Alphaproteobacteria bacterium]